MTNVVERYAGLSLGVPPISEVAHRVILSSYGDNSQRSLINLANSNPDLFNKVVLDHLKIREKNGHDVENEIMLHHSWHYRRKLESFLESDDQTMTSIGLQIIDDKHGPWSKVEKYFRNHVALRLSQEACHELVHIEIPEIGEKIEKRIGSFIIANSFLLNDCEKPYSSLYELARA